MANTEFDVKSVVDRMESKGDGCALLFNEAFQLLNKDIPGQLKMLGQVEQEAKGRSDNTLSFEHVDESTTDPRSKRNLHYEGVNIYSKEGKAIFQEIITSDADSKKLLAVQKTCKPGSEKR